MATKKAPITFKALMAMKEEPFFDFVLANGYAEQVKAIASRQTEQKVYPRILKPSKKNPEKLTYQADKTQKPSIKVKPITFLEVKSAFAEEVLGLEKKAPTKKETFRDRIKNL